MIFFVPAYDECTHANLTLAQFITTHGCIKLFDVNATEEALIQELTQTTLPLFAMSHGDIDKLKAQNGQIALSDKNSHCLGKRSIYAYACNTSIKLGQSAAKIGSTWWGYSCPISCVPNSPSVQSLFANIFTFIRDHFHQAVTSQQRQAVLDELKKKCEHAKEQLIEHYVNSSELKTEEFLTLLQIWDRLRIWAPGLQEPEKHPTASEPAPDWF
ncbi:MAG: hypothetical protein VSS75_020415 [Candidatus Parabeggiatoa sp.]|nr:hypothetical protein [Candidatus Parabeggiatoa sp.]